jgi:diguanylate cyclase (GGDEF)-like protein
MDMDNGMGFYDSKIPERMKNIPGRNLVHYRWIVALVLVPLFYIASMMSFGFVNFLRVMLGVGLYNALVTYYLVREYPKSRHIPDYIYYIDAGMLSVLVFFFGGIRSDIYTMFLFIIASYGVVHSVPKTLKFSLVVVSMYSFSSFLYGTMENGLWILSEEFVELLMRNVSIFIISYAVGLLIVEARKSDHLHRKEFQRARTDKLTGLPNRHYMEQILESELNDCEQNEKVMNVLMFDIDNFKRFNDTYGHLWGDELLKRFAEILDQSVRKADIPIRYGGEEFIVILKDIDFVTANGVANRVRRQLENQKIDVDDGKCKTRVTVSCGMAQYPTHSKDIKEVIKMADKALYFAKEHGKNQVIGYEELEERSHREAFFMDPNEEDSQVAPASYVR